VSELIQSFQRFKNRFTLSNKELSICLTNVSISVTFNRLIHINNGFVSGINFSVDPNPNIFDTTVNVELDNIINVNKFHVMMGPCGVDNLQKTLS
jgi:hypothetical protein